MLATYVDQRRRQHTVLWPLCDERQKPLWAATEAQKIGRGGVTRVSEVTGLSRTTIDAGLKEIATGAFETTRGISLQGGSVGLVGVASD
ncbi:MAG: hypothetical protein OXC63_01605 [Aestuariivita sp.]|nr:hypothetical protein [Aestuariivita sp.]